VPLTIFFLRNSPPSKHPKIIKTQTPVGSRHESCPPTLIDRGQIGFLTDKDKQTTLQIMKKTSKQIDIY
jgi:hypothetical protein